jgi:hypothetical protein
MGDELADRHPNFRGNRDDLRHFLALAGSQIRNEAREGALRAWEGYKLERQLAHARSSPHGLGKKGGYMRALVARVIDLSGANLSGICVGYADLRGVTLDGCSLRGAWLKGAKLENASLRNADFSAGGRNGRLLYADLCRADLPGANLRGVDLSYAALNDATLAGADLTDADMQRATLVRANLGGAVLQNTRIYGVSAWDLQGQPAVQQDLVISPMLTESREDDRLGVSVDNLDVAQFVYLLLNNKKIRDVIDTITSKVVLILGRFTPERKPVLDALREQLRRSNPPYVPVMFDFEKPLNRNFIDTVATLAHMARFVIADVTDPKIVLEEIPHIVRNIAVPVQPLLQEEAGAEPVTLYDLRHIRSLLKTVTYKDQRDLAALLPERVIAPAEALAAQLRSS